MKIFVVWNGGSGYGPSDRVDDLEVHYSISAAASALIQRRRYGYSQKQHFPFVNRDSEYVFTPCVEDDSSMWCWFTARDGNNDGELHVPDYPDFILEFGPRGGVRKVAA